MNQSAPPQGSNVPNTQSTPTSSVAPNRIADLNQQSAELTYEVIVKLKETLKSTLGSSRNLQYLTTTMYVLTFLLAFALIIVAMWMGLDRPQVSGEGQPDWLGYAFGGGGVLLIIINMLTNPPSKLQSSRSNYAQLSIAMIGWFAEWLDNANLRSNLPLKEALNHPENSLEEFHRLVAQQNRTTEHYLRMMDEFAEPRDSGKSKSQSKASQAEVE